MGLMRKLTTSIDDYPTNHAAVARNYQQLLQQQQQQQQQHPDPSTAHQQQQMQQNFAAGHPHAAAKFNQFNYPNPGGLLKPCYDYQSSQQQHQHPMQGPGSTAGTVTGSGAPNQQMKKEIFNLSGTNGVDLYSPPASATASVSSSAATTPSSNGSSSFMNLHQPSAAAAAAAAHAAAAAMYANHFNNGAGPNGANKLDANGVDGGGGLVDFNAMRNNATPNSNSNNSSGNKLGGNNLIKSAESVLMARSSIMNNLNNNLNKIEPNTDTTTLNDSNNNTHNHHHQQQGHNLGHGGGGFNGNGGTAEDEIDKLSSPMTGTSTLTNTDLNDPSEQDEADDGYTIL